MFEQDHSYTRSHMAKLLGLPHSRSFLSDVLRGKQISDVFLERFIILFGFDSDEANYFRTLVHLNQSKNADERELYFEQLISLSKTPKRILFRDTYEYYKNWYNAALRALLNIYDFDGKDFSTLSRKLVPSVPVPKIRQSFKLLIKLNLIAENENGFFKPTDASISTEEYMRDEVLRQLQIKCLQLATDALVQNSNQPKAMSINTISISDNGLKQIEKQIDCFRSQVRSIIQKDQEKAQHVYQIDVLFFPMSQ
jgi:uncharacterized protein (TIGR02147 family)